MAKKLMIIYIILREPFAPVILRSEATKDLAQDKLRDRRISLWVNSVKGLDSSLRMTIGIAKWP